MKWFLALIALGVLLTPSCSDSKRIEELETEVTRLRVEMLVSQKALGESWDRTSESVDKLESTKTELEEALGQVDDLEEKLSLRSIDSDADANTSFGFTSSAIDDRESLKLVKFDPFNFNGFIDGERIELDELEDGTIVPFYCDYVRDFLVAEVVPESPGPEVLVGVLGSPCATSRWHYVLIFAGDTPDAIQLGGSLPGYLLRVDDDNGVLTGVRDWSADRGWVNCCPDELIVSKYHWIDEDWETEWTETWRIKERLEGQDLIEIIEDSVPVLIERVGIRGTKILAPRGWAYEYIDGGGSGSRSYWKNQDNSFEEVGLITGASFGTWLGLDGVKGSVDPTDNIIFDWGDDVVIEKIDDRTFNFTVGTTDEKNKFRHVSTSGVWVAHLGGDGSCCVAFTQAWITLGGLSEVHNEVVKEFREYVVSNIS